MAATDPDPLEKRGESPSATWPRRVLLGSWVLILLGLGLRAWRNPSFAGTYDSELDALLYSGQRLLRGRFLYADHVLPFQPLAQYLYAPSALLGSVPAHRLLLFLVDGLGGGLLLRTVVQFSRAGLLPLASRSLVPPMAGVLLVVFSQMFSGGVVGNLHHYANLLLVLALFFLSRNLARTAAGAAAGPTGPRPSLTIDLLLAGACFLLAIECFRSLASSFLIGAAVLLVRSRRPLPALGTLLLGGVLAVVGEYLPYVFLPRGPALALAGAVVLPLQWAGRSTAEVTELPAVMGELLTTSVAGLPVWLLCLLPALGLLRLAVRQWRAGAEGGDEPLLIPALSLIVLLDQGWTLQRGHVESQDLLLLVVPLLLMVAAGLAELERHHRRGTRGLVVTALVVFSLLFFNNIFVATVFSSPRQPRGEVAAVEADRTLLRRHLAVLPAAEGGVTAPQDIALQWQVGRPASTRGIGPEWSLNQQNLRASWATSTLGLPTTAGQACEQLLAPSNRYLVWRLDDPEGPNGERILKACLQGADAGTWREIGTDLGLASGQWRVLRRVG